MLLQRGQGRLAATVAFGKEEDGRNAPRSGEVPSRGSGGKGRVRARGALSTRRLKLKLSQAGRCRRAGGVAGFGGKFHAEHRGWQTRPRQRAPRWSSGAFQGERAPVPQDAWAPAPRFASGSPEHLPANSHLPGLRRSRDRCSPRISSQVPPCGRGVGGARGRGRVVTCPASSNRRAARA